MSIILKRILLVLVPLLGTWAPGAAQEDGDPVSIGTYRLIESQALGETRRLLIHLPRGYEGSAIDYPVIYHTYGDYLSSYYAPAYVAVEALGNDARMPQAILVGIDNIDRYRDLRPLQNNGQPAGIEAYTEFLTTEVIPFIEETYRTADYRILVGPQAGAVFGLHTMLHQPELFEAFILDNPFVSKPNTEVLMTKAAQVFAAGTTFNNYCFLTYGGESEVAVAHVERFAGLTRDGSRSRLNLHLNRLHGDVDYLHPGAFRAALEQLFSTYHLSQEDAFSSLADLEAFYGQLSLEYGFEVAPAEIMMTYSADALLQQGEIDAALEILHREIELYPTMVNAFWRLAGIAADRGKNEEAIGYYRRCMEINPQMANFANRQIEALKGN